MWIENGQAHFEMTRQALEDLIRRKLRLVNSFDETFVRDPRRILRLVRFKVEKELEVEHYL